MHPKDVPLSEWKDSWLRLTVAGLCNQNEYIMMQDREKRMRGLPVTRDEMIKYIGDNSVR